MAGFAQNDLADDLTTPNCKHPTARVLHGAIGSGGSSGSSSAHASGELESGRARRTQSTMAPAEHVVATLAHRAALVVCRHARA